MLHEEKLDAIASTRISGGLVPLDVAVSLMGEGFYVEEIEFETNHFNPDFN